MQLDLEDQEVAALVAVLGELPTKTGVFPLREKIQAQAISAQASIQKAAIIAEYAERQKVDANDNPS